MVQRFLLDHISAITNQKFNQLYLQGYQPLQSHPEDLFEGPYHSPWKLRISPHTTPPISRKQLKGRHFAQIPDSQPLPSSLLKKNRGMIEQ
jgi:hypothetical protein